MSRAALTRVRAGARFKDGLLVERTDAEEKDQAA